jgi:hypothetical protein
MGNVAKRIYDAGDSGSMLQGVEGGEAMKELLSCIAVLTMCVLMVVLVLI